MTMKIAMLLVLYSCQLSWGNNGPIKIITNNWTSQIVLSHVVGELFVQKGYQVQYVTSLVDQQWGALAHGAAHVQVEVWQGTMEQAFERLVNQGQIEDMGAHTASTREDWWYPKYVEASCPGLPDWRALKKCAAIFSADGKGPGIYWSGPWEKPDEARIRALGLNFKVQEVLSGDELWVVLKKASQSQRPVVLFNWTPNWVESRYEGKFIEFPIFQKQCETDPGWGVNPDFNYDCGNPKGGWLKKAAWNGLMKSWPCAYKILKKVNLNNGQIASAAALVDVDGLSYQDAAKKWMIENKSTWETWLEACHGD